MGTPQGNTPRLLGKPCLWMNLTGKPEGHAILRGLWEHLTAWEDSSWLRHKDSGKTSWHGSIPWSMGRPHGRAARRADIPHGLPRAYG